jgi:3-oxoacyl-[acyl-carrier protein] reductase
LLRPPHPQVPGRCAIVTGGSRGIGLAIAKRLSTQGLAVALLARDRDALVSAAAEIAEMGGTCAPIPCDVTDRAAVESALQEACAHCGPPLVLVNNAGYGGPFHTLDQVSDDNWDRVFHTNVRAAFWLCRALLPGMRAAGFGRIVNIASVEGLIGAAQSANYIASKHALIGYTRAIASEWGRFGITCNAICPGFVDTGMVAGFDAAQLGRRIPAGRLGTADEIARVAAFLASEESGYLNGSVIAVDGGLLADLGIHHQERI